MRHAFFGANALEELSAEIVLTPLEAFAGTTVPMGIPVRQTCLSCGGRGETWQEWCEVCGGCGDLRAFHDVSLRVPAGVRAGARFRFAVMPPGAPLTRVDVLISIRDTP
jgi:DnaJ-class molecular chaperone